MLTKLSLELHSLPDPHERPHKIKMQENMFTFPHISANCMFLALAHSGQTAWAPLCLPENPPGTWALSGNLFGTRVFLQQQKSYLQCCFHKGVGINVK